MFKLLVLSCLLVSCLADSFGLPSGFRESGREYRHPQGCANRAQGWRACARLNGSDSLAPHGRDCSLFFYCRSSARPACRKCPAGLHFNPQLQVCDWPENANCTAQRPPHPPRPHHNGTTPYPSTSGYNATVTVINGTITTDGITTNKTTTTESARTDTTVPYYTTTDSSGYGWRNYIPWRK